MSKALLKNNLETSILSSLLIGLLFASCKGGYLLYHLHGAPPLPFGGNLFYFLYFSSIYLLLFSLIGFAVGSFITFMVKGKPHKSLLSRIIGINFTLCFFIFFSPWGNRLGGDLFWRLGNLKGLYFYSLLLTISIVLGIVVYFLALKIRINSLVYKTIKIFISGYFVISLIGFGVGCFKTFAFSQKSNTSAPLVKRTTSHSKNTPIFKNKNVILITIDTLRADHLSCYGYERKTSPHIDDFASRGILFTNAVVQKTKTSPSVASILTGTYPSTHGIDGCGEELYNEALTIPEVLKRDGYKTCSIVENGNLGYEFNFDQGFDKVYEMWRIKGIKAEKTTDTAINWLENNHKSKFFLYLHYIGPHSRYAPSDPYNKLFLNDKFYGKYKRDLNIQRKLEIKSSTYWNAIHEENVLLKGPLERNFDYYISQYDGEIKHHDEHIGRLFKRIEELGIDKDTLIILTADHGEDFGEHDVYFNHGIFAYESCARVPFIVSHPELSKNRQSEFLVQSIDIFPTILDFLGLKREQTLQGNSLMTVLSNSDLENPDFEEYGFVEGNYGHAIETALRTREWKLIYTPYILDGSARDSVNLTSFYSPSFILGAEYYHNVLMMRPFKNYNMMYELYNVKNDPDEQENLFFDKPTLAESLKERLHGWLKEHPRMFVKDLKKSKKKAGKKLSDETIKNLKALGYIN